VGNWKVSVGLGVVVLIFAFGLLGRCFAIPI